MNRPVFGVGLAHYEPNEVSAAWIHMLAGPRRAGCLADPQGWMTANPPEISEVAQS